VPSSFRVHSLGAVCTFVGGGTPSRKIPEYFSGDIPWATVKDFKRFRITDTEDHITEKAIADSATNLVDPGTVLLVSRVGLGKVAIADCQLAINQDIKALTPNSKLLPEYLFWFLLSKASDIERMGAGATVKGITLNDIKAIQIPVPSLPEQRRIVDLLFRAEGIVRLRHDADKKAAELIPALFLDMFGDPATNPKGWPMARMGDLAEKMSDGPFGSNLKTSHYVESGIRVIRLQNIGIGELIDDVKAYVSPEHFASLPRHRCLPADVIIGTLGDPNLRAFVLPSTIPEALNKADCVQFRCRQDVVSPAYICWLMNMPSTLAMAASLVQGITLTRISMGRLREMIVPVPPIDVQQVFADRVEMMNAIKSQQSAATAKAKATFDALLANSYRSLDVAREATQNASESCY